MLEVDDGTVADTGKHIISLIGGTHRLQQCGILGVVARGSHQSRHGTSGTCAVGDDALGIARHLLVEVAQVADGGFQVEYGLWRTTSIDGLSFLHAFMCLGVCFIGHNGGIASASAGNHHHITFLQGPARGIACLWLGGRRCHIATDVSAQENGRLLRCSVRHIHVEELVCRVLHVGHVEQPFVGRIADLRAVVSGHP